MSKAEQYYRMFEQGHSYSQIADRYGVHRNTVAARIHEYRKDNGISPTYRNMPDKLKKATLNKKATNPVYTMDEQVRKQRRKELAKCKVTDEGVTICPSRS